MLKAILFDLDDTLLGNPMDIFIPVYFQALTRSVAHLIPPEHLIAGLLRATNVMDANDGGGLTNQEAFAAAFFPALGHERATLEPIFDQFYAKEFSKLQSLTRQLPEARSLVEWAFERGLQVVIATNPFFPRTAIEQRIEWAGVPVTEFDYALVTTYEIMHATKSHLAYYHEILNRLALQPGECLMVGDSWENDIVPAAAVGISTYWIAEPDIPLPTRDVTPVGQGRLADLWAWVEAGGLAL
jgi:FMN phosphatase YigB (HAD superfamily)